jgi:hypothetical protein
VRSRTARLFGGRDGRGTGVAYLIRICGVIMGGLECLLLWEVWNVYYYGGSANMFTNNMSTNMCLRICGKSRDYYVANHVNMWQIT